MSNKDRVFVCLYFRQGFTNNPAARQQYQHAAYHWAIFVAPKGSEGPGFVYDVKFTDPYSNIPGSGGWQYYGGSADLSRTRSILGQIMIGKLPPNTRADDVNQILGGVPIPQDDVEPTQNCVTWISHGIQELQRHGCAEPFDVNAFMDDALQRGDEWFAQNTSLTGPIPKENYTQRKFP